MSHPSCCELLSAMSSVSSEDSDFDYDDIPLTLDAPKHYEDDAPTAFASLGASNNNHGAPQEDEWEPPPTTRGGRSSAVSAFASPNPPTSATAAASAFASAGAPFSLGSLRKLPRTPEHDEEPMPSSRHAADSPPPEAHAPTPPRPMPKLSALPLKGMLLLQPGEGNGGSSELLVQSMQQDNASVTFQPTSKTQTELQSSRLRESSSEPTPSSPQPAVTSRGGDGGGFSSSGGGEGSGGGAGSGSGSGLQSVRSLRLPQLRLSLADPAGASPMATPSSGGGGGGGEGAASASTAGHPAGPAASAAPFAGLVPPLGATRPAGERPESPVYGVWCMAQLPDCHCLVRLPSPPSLCAPFCRFACPGRSPYRDPPLCSLSFLIV